MAKDEGQPIAKANGTIIDMEKKVDQWFTDHFHGVIGMTTELHNKFYEAKEELKKILKGE